MEKEIDCLETEDEQLTFFNGARNPLQQRLGEKFFDELPTDPGVYLMYGRAGRVLYVGKAKNLRKRLFTYRRVTPENGRRKTKKLVRMTTDIEIRRCETEEAALLKENALIREHRPDFNRAKKSPETYYYLSFWPAEDRYRFWLAMELPEEQRKIAHTFGAFKGHRTIRKGTGALLRQLYLLEHDISSAFDLPTVLTNNLTPLAYELPATKRPIGDEMLREFLSGQSEGLIEELVAIVTERGLLGEYIGRLVLTDCEALKYFYERCLKRNAEIKETLNLTERLIPQQKLDDYIIRAAFKE